MKVLYTHPEAGEALFVDGEIVIEQFTDVHEQIAASLPIGPVGMRVMAYRLLELATEIEAGLTT
ncbi:MAG: hypothetical protein KAY02_06865 [Acidovorax sp.]|nr:hypothetical protein [Acidovorax sp.]